MIAVGELPEPDSHAAVPGPELSDEGRQDADRERTHGGDLQLAALEGLRLSGSHPGALRGGQHRPRLRQHLAAGGGQAHAARRALEQDRADVPLERLDLLRKRRLRNPQLPRGHSERARLGHCDEVRDLPQRHVGQSIGAAYDVNGKCTLALTPRSR